MMTVCDNLSVGDDGREAGEEASPAMSQTLPLPLFNPFAPGFTDDPYPQYAAVRAAAPVYQHPLGFWLLTCYDDVSWLLRASLSVEDRNITASPLLERRAQMYGE